MPSSTTKSQPFGAFPQFSKLTIADKNRYEALVKDYPPMYDLSFASLMTWWNSMDTMALSHINDNLIIPYWLPGDESRSGLSLVGTTSIDESICAIFDHLREKGDPVRLVNVPEFVVNSIAHSDLFLIEEDKYYNDYIIPLSRFYPLDNMVGYRRRKVERLLTKFGDRIQVKSIDLRLDSNQQLIMKAARKWQRLSINNYGRVELEVMEAHIARMDELGIGNVCLFIDGYLHGFCMYDTPYNNEYVMAKHIKATHKSMLRFELIAYEFAKWFSERGFKYANIGPDNDILRLRAFMLTLGASNFFRKYRIEPAL